MAHFTERRRAFAAVIRERREAVGLTQAQFATESGMDLLYIEEIEDGERGTLPSEHQTEANVWQRLATALGMQADHLRADIRERAEP